MEMKRNDCKNFLIWNKKNLLENIIGKNTKKNNWKKIIKIHWKKVRKTNYSKKMAKGI